MTYDQDFEDIVAVLDEHQTGYEILLDLIRAQQEQINCIQNVLNEEQFCEDPYVYDASPDFEAEYDEYIPFTQVNLAVMSQRQKDAVLTDLAICLDHGRLVDFVTGWRADEDAAVPRGEPRFDTPHVPLWASLARPWETDNYYAEIDG